MKTKLLNFNGDLLTYSAINAMENLEPNIIKTKDLYGEYHIQTIGNTAKGYKFEATVTENQKKELNKAHSIGERLVLYVDDEMVVGLIDERPQWELLTKRYRDISKRLYTAEIIFLKESAEIAGAEY